MSEVLIRPRRPLRQEIYSLAAVLAIPVALICIFPLEVFNIRVCPDKQSPSASCAFVVLSDEEAARALSNARAAWRVDADGVRSLRVDLSVETMPDEPHVTVMHEVEREHFSREQHLQYQANLLPPTQAAQDPLTIKPESLQAPVMQETFSRDDLLKLD